MNSMRGIARNTRMNREIRPAIEITTTRLTWGDIIERLYRLTKPSSLES